MPCNAQNLIRMITAISAATLLSACSSPSYNKVSLSNASYSVADAYETSGVVAVPPYTRSIFSSTNF